MKRSLPLLLLALALLATVPGAAPTPADAQEAITLRIAMRSARRGSVWRRTLDAWDQSLRTATNGQIRMAFSDPEDFAAQLGRGSLEGASMPVADLGELAGEVRVLGAPGLITSYDQADRVVRGMGGDFEARFAAQGYKVLGWFDIGLTRILSKRPIAQPSDLRGLQAWTPTRDQAFTKFLEVVGARPVRLPMEQVAGRLGSLDVVPTSALAAIFMNWYHEMNHITQQGRGVIMAATVVKQEAFDRLSAEQQAALLESARRAHEILRRNHRRQDDEAMRTLAGRGYTMVDIAPHQAAWDAASLQARNGLAGSLYPRALLDQVTRAIR